MFEKIFAPTEKRELTTAESNAEVLRSIALSETMITAETAMQIPMVARCVNMIAGAVAMLPIRMYRRIDGKVEEITEDRRLELLNTDTGDTMNADYMRYAWVRDLILCGNAYAYIERKGGKPENIYYVAAKDVGVYRNEMDPIHKEFTYNVGGRNIKPWEMLKILRDTDGYGTGTGIVEENRDILSTALSLITYQRNIMKRGGGKRGILRTQNNQKDYLEKLKRKWASMWTSSSEYDSIFIINSSDMDFKELSSSSVEMQLNETQKTIDEELMKLFGTNDGLLSDETVKNAVMPIIDMIEAALDSDLLMEREKGTYYFAFDTRELTRGDINQRYSAYATALSQNFLQLDEVRALEDLPPLGINFVKLGLNDVLLDPRTGQIYTPNTNQYATMGESGTVPVNENSGLTDDENKSIIENRGKGNPNHLPAGSPKGGQFTSSERAEDLKYLPQAKEYTKSIKGTVSSQGKVINLVTCHAARRMNERNVSVEELKDTIKNAPSTYPSSKQPNATMYKLNDVVASIGNDGNIITVINLALSEDDD